MEPLKPCIQLLDAEGRIFTLELNVENRRIGVERVLVLNGAVSLKNASVVTVRIVRAVKWPFLSRHVRFTGDCVTTQAEVARQLNELFAEE